MTARYRRRSFDLPSIKWQIRLGQRDAREGIPPILNTPAYLSGYGREYEAGEKHSEVEHENL